MSLEKAIEHGKEKRRPYRDCRRFDPSCRNHKSCPYCRSTRTHLTKRQNEAARAEVNYV